MLAPTPTPARAPRCRAVSGDSPVQPSIAPMPASWYLLTTSVGQQTGRQLRDCREFLEPCAIICRSRDASMNHVHQHRRLVLLLSNLLTVLWPNRHTTSSTLEVLFEFRQ